jgi:hypothetical protein
MNMGWMGVTGRRDEEGRLDVVPGERGNRGKLESTCTWGCWSSAGSTAASVSAPIVMQNARNLDLNVKAPDC